MRGVVRTRTRKGPTQPRGNEIAFGESHKFYFLRLKYDEAEKAFTRERERESERERERERERKKEGNILFNVALNTFIWRQAYCKGPLR